MADNLLYTPGAGASVATDEIAGVHYQRVKNVWGADGTATDVSEANPMPVAERRTSSAPNRGTQNDQATSFTMLSANSSRTGLTVENRSSSTLFLRLAASAATVTDFDVVIPSNARYEMPEPIWTGEIRGIWSADSTGFCRWTEFV